MDNALFNIKNHKYSSRISGLATFLMVVGFVLLILGLYLLVFHNNFLPLVSGVLILMLRPVLDGFGFIVYNAENQMLKDMSDNE